VADSRIAAAAAQKRPRGRPPAFSPEAMAIARSTGARSRRSQQDFLYRLKAAHLLRRIAALRSSAAARLSWLIDLETGRCLQPSVLAELGRINDNRAMLRLALALCDVKPPTKVAINWIRQKRREGLDRSKASTPSLVTVVAKWHSSHLTS